MNRFPFLVALAFACGCVAAVPAERSIFQKGRAFSESAITIKVGETILIVNNDTVAHNAMSTSPGNEFNLGAQLPGQESPVTFNTPGDVKIICAIHPRMQMTVRVTQ